MILLTERDCKYLLTGLAVIEKDMIDIITETQKDLEWQLSQDKKDKVAIENLENVISVSKEELEYFKELKLKLDIGKEVLN